MQQNPRGKTKKGVAVTLPRRREGTTGGKTMAAITTEWSYSFSANLREKLGVAFEFYWPEAVDKLSPDSCPSESDSSTVLFHNFS